MKFVDCHWGTTKAYLDSSDLFPCVQKNAQILGVMNREGGMGQIPSFTRPSTRPARKDALSGRRKGLGDGSVTIGSPRQVTSRFDHRISTEMPYRGLRSLQSGISKDRSPRASGCRTSAIWFRGRVPELTSCRCPQIQLLSLPVHHQPTLKLLHLLQLLLEFQQLLVLVVSTLTLAYTVGLSVTPVIGGHPS